MTINKSKQQVSLARILGCTHGLDAWYLVLMIKKKVQFSTARSIWYDCKLTSSWKNSVLQKNVPKGQEISFNVLDLEKTFLILLTSASCLYVFIGQHFAGKNTWCADRIGSWSFMVCIFGVDNLANLALQEGDDLSRAKSCFGCAKVRQELIAI